MWLESSLLARSVLHLAHLASIIDVSVLAVHLSVLVLGLNLEGAISGLVAERIRAIVIVTVQLLQDGHRGRRLLRVLVRVVLTLLLLGQSHGRQAQNDQLRDRIGGVIYHVLNVELL